MNPNRSRNGRVIHKTKNDESDMNCKKNDDKRREIQEMIYPKRTVFLNRNRLLANRSCYVSPEKRDFNEQFTPDIKTLARDKSLTVAAINTFKHDSRRRTINQIECPIMVASETQWQEVEEKCPIMVASETQWQEVEEADKLIKNDQPKRKVIPQTVHISDVPRIKIIAENFTKYKKNNIELRKLDERIVCLEYDVFDKTDVEDNSCLPPDKPALKMRAFFSVKPRSSGTDEQQLEQIPSNIRSQFNIAAEDLQKLSNKEIEIIDDKISENKSYLEDLKRILKRSQVLQIKRHKSKLDLLSLYEMARKEYPVLEEISNTNLLSKAELDEIKDMILNKCVSSLHGIRRKTIVKQNDENVFNPNVISQTIVAEINRNKC